MNNTPLVVPNFNQFTYLLNIITWWRFYYPKNPVYVIDNGSEWHSFHKAGGCYDRLQSMFNGITVWKRAQNDCVGNLKDFLSLYNSFEYYVISDPDIMPLPSTPPNFLEIFKHAIDAYGYHHAGFGLKADDVPDWMPGRANMLHDENMLLHNPVTIEHAGKSYSGHRAPIDTTFAMYKRSNGGWTNPQPEQTWNNSIRLFQAYHLPWYLHPDHLNDEMKNYYKTATYRIPGVTSTGVNNYRPVSENYKAESEIPVKYAEGEDDIAADFHKANQPTPEVKREIFTAPVFEELKPAAPLTYPTQPQNIQAQHAQSKEYIPVIKNEAIHQSPLPVDEAGLKYCTKKDIVTPELEAGAIYNNEFHGFHEDYLVLHCLLRIYKPNSIMEIGTNMGTGTKIMKNAWPAAQVFSMDLPTELCHLSLQHPINEGKGDKVGMLCDLPFTQLRGDSMTFDFSPYPCEAWFIDGEHEEKNVYHETSEAIKQNARLIIFHDADIPGVWAGITKGFADQPYIIYRVTDTRICFALKK